MGLASRDLIPCETTELAEGRVCFVPSPAPLLLCTRHKNAAHNNRPCFAYVNNKFEALDWSE